MRNLLQKLSFSLWYFGRPPWDSGITPPELWDFIHNHPAGRAIDLGCGSGTNAIALAQNGWQATGVDFAGRAIQMAKRKAQNAGATIDFRVGDVTRLRDVEGPFDLALDMGCFHSLTVSQRLAYLHNLERLLAAGGFWLLYGFFKPDARPGAGLLETDIELAAVYFQLVERKDGVDKRGRPSAWFLFRLSNHHANLPRRPQRTRRKPFYIFANCALCAVQEKTTAWRETQPPVGHRRSGRQAAVVLRQPP